MKNIDKSRFVKSYKYTSGGYWAYQRRMCVCVCVCVCVQNKVDCRWLFTIFGMQRNAPGAVAIRLHFKPFRVHALEELCNRRWSSALTNKCKRSIVDTAAACALYTWATYETAAEFQITDHKSIHRLFRPFPLLLEVQRSKRNNKV